MNSNANYQVSRFCLWVILIGIGLIWFSCAEVFDLPGSSSAPRITRVSPDSGAEGMRVVISGQHFSKTLSENAVTFNGKDAVVAAALDTQLVALVPAHAGTGKIQVTVRKLAVEGPVFTFFERPVINRISPLEGKPGTVVTIYGKYFDKTATNNIVRFGGKTGTVTPPAIDSVLTVSVPADAQTGPVTVTVNGIEGVGPTFTVLASNTPVHSVTSFTPTSGQAGTIVTITGVNFDPTPANDIVKFNGVVATVSNATATTLTVVAPASTTGLVSVAINNITANGSTFTYIDNTPVPTITNYDPAQGFVGDVVAIVGTNFSNVTTGNTVKFNGVAAVVTQASPTLLKVTVPPGATTGPITVTVGTKTATGTTFTVLDNSPTITSFNPTSGPVGAGVIITGTNFGTDPAAVQIMFNGVLASVQQITPTSLITVVPNGATTGKITVTVNGKTGTSMIVFTVTNGASNTLALTGGLSYPRSGHTATLLPNGKVLIAGGSGPNATFIPCEIYDPATGTFTTTGSMVTPRAEHNAFLLSNGTVLIIGGHNGTNTATKCELYDPGTGQWTETGSMADIGLPPNPGYRFGSERAVMLADGRVLTTGGGNAFAPNGFKAEVYDPATAQSTLTGIMPDGDRVFHTNTLLNNGKVLVAGEDHGDNTQNSVLFDPATNAWTTTGPLPLNRIYATAVLLASGNVLLAGGYEYVNSAGTTLCTLYDPGTGNWTATGPMSRARLNLASVLLPSGKVLVVGGAKSDVDYEVYDPATGTWPLSGASTNIPNGRNKPTLTLLPNGQVLIVGGTNYITGSAIPLCELYTP